MANLRSERGVTLVELMLVVLISGMVSVMALGVLLNTSGSSSSYTQGIDAEIDELAATNALQSVFSQAVELKLHSPANGDLNGFVSGTGEGRVRVFDSDTVFGAFPPAHTLAVFWRDRTNSSLTGISSLTSALTPTGIYFQKPTPNTWGVLYINLGTGPSLEPTRSDLIFEGLTRVRVFNISTYSPTGVASTPGRPVTAFDIELTFRRFIGDVKNERKLFCPDSAIATVPACANVGAHRDVRKVFRVLARNNTLALSPSNNLLGAKLYDLIHFFGPGRTGVYR